MRRTTTVSTLRKTAFIVTAAFIFVSGGLASTQITDVSHTPGIISAGDEVNISLMLESDDFVNDDFEIESRMNTSLEPGSYRSERYIEIVDREGAFTSDTSTSSYLYPDGIWSEKYTVKVSQKAPTGSYELVHNVDMIHEDSNGVRHNEQEFSIHVDRDGADLTATTARTEPQTPRAGDDHVTQTVRLTNTGEKKLENLVVRPETPEGIEKAYSSDERYLVGAINPGSSQTIDIGLDISEELEPGLHQVLLQTEYEDSDDNIYQEQISTSLRVDGRPDLEVVNSSMEMKAGESRELSVSIENTGDQDAESVTARLIAERSQPFSLEDRSNYVGEIESGESAEAVLKVSADRKASLKSHNVKIQLRANGDSEEGDQSVYTFTEQTQVELTGRTESPLIYVGVVAGALVLIAAIIRLYRRSGEEEE